MGYYNKFDFIKSLGVYYWYVKMPRWGCVEHRKLNITFHVQEYIAHLAACSGHLLVRDGPLGVTAFVKLAYFHDLAILMDRCNTIYSIEIHDILSDVIHSIPISDLYAYILRIVWPSHGYLVSISYIKNVMI